MPTTKDKPATLPERDHLEGCPAERVERYEAPRPRKTLNDDGEPVIVHSKVVVIRCIDCGGERVERPRAPTTEKEGEA